MMRNYECMLILDQGLSEDLIRKEIEAIRENLSGCPVTFREIGLRELSYPIRKKTRGYYLLCHFQSEPALKEDLDRRLRLNQSVLRHMVLGASEAPAPESEAEPVEAPAEGDAEGVTGSAPGTA